MSGRKREALVMFDSSAHARKKKGNDAEREEREFGYLGKRGTRTEIEDDVGFQIEGKKKKGGPKDLLLCLGL
ncbi:unnamed protein product [Arabidopsis thaliana]|uniref:Uncharacterized protein n=1 Tax=Arabidopsis thaliana TaxID=3702 RepID=A0A5S9X0Y3_ARATH|nr:unnamed protein product [Arabidopsis thaliana]